LQQFGSLDGSYANLDKVAKGIRAKLERERENAYLSQKLGRIVTNVPGVELKLEEGRTTDFNLVDVANLFVELEFNTIFRRIPGAPADKLPKDIATIKLSGASSPIPPDGTYITINTLAGLANLTAALQKSNRLCVDVETDSTDEVQTNLVGIAITPSAGQGYYIPVGHRAADNNAQQASIFATAATVPAPPQLPLNAVQQALAPILAAPGVTKYMHNAKFDMTVLQRHGMPVKTPIFDTMIASWLTNNAPDAKHGLKDLALSELHIQMTPIKDLIGTGKAQITMAQVPLEKATPYAAADVDMTLRLADRLEKRLNANEKLRAIFTNIELPLIDVLKEMELTGIIVDVAVLKEISHKLTHRLAKLEDEIHAEAGESFNINSTQQLSDILFGKMQLPTTGLKKTKAAIIPLRPAC